MIPATLEDDVVLNDKKVHLTLVVDRQDLNTDIDKTNAIVNVRDVKRAVSHPVFRILEISLKNSSVDLRLKFLKSEKVNEWTKCLTTFCEVFTIYRVAWFDLCRFGNTRASDLAMKLALGTGGAYRMDAYCEEMYLGKTSGHSKLVIKARQTMDVICQFSDVIAVFTVMQMNTPTESHALCLVLSGRQYVVLVHNSHQIVSSWRQLLAVDYGMNFSTVKQAAFKLPFGASSSSCHLKEIKVHEFNESQQTDAVIVKHDDSAEHFLMLIPDISKQGVDLLRSTRLQLLVIPVCEISNVFVDVIEHPGTRHKASHMAVICVPIRKLHLDMCTRDLKLARCWKDLIVDSAWLRPPSHNQFHASDRDLMCTILRQDLLQCSRTRGVDTIGSRSIPDRFRLSRMKHRSLSTDSGNSLAKRRSLRNHDQMCGTIHKLIMKLNKQLYPKRNFSDYIPSKLRSRLLPSQEHRETIGVTSVDENDREATADGPSVHQISTTMLGDCDHEKRGSIHRASTYGDFLLQQRLEILNKYPRDSGELISRGSLPQDDETKDELQCN